MANVDSEVINLCIVEEVEIYREIYKSVFSLDNRIRILGNFLYDDFQALRTGLKTRRPDVLLLGTRRLESSTITELEDIRENFPEIGIVLLLMIYDLNNIQLLKKLASRGGTGMAVFLKQSLQRVDELYSIIDSVNGGHVILDPALTSLLFSERKGHPLVNEFTQRELEILSLIASGYTNSAIAETLYIDIRTVQRHINNMYCKVRNETDVSNKHLRVSAARIYLENTGELITSQSTK